MSPGAPSHLLLLSTMLLQIPTVLPMLRLYWCPKFQTTFQFFTFFLSASLKIKQKLFPLGTFLTPILVDSMTTFLPKIGHLFYLPWMHKAHITIFWKFFPRPMICTSLLSLKNLTKISIKKNPG